jgi:ATP-dependent helicase/DNAse subunit B
MKFYYRYLNGLKEPEKVSKDIDPAMLGSILHEIMRSLYHEFLGKVLTGEMLSSIIRNRQLLSVVINEAVNEKLRQGRDGFISGNELIVRDVLMAYLIRILNTDKALAPLTILNLEDPFSFKLSTLSNGSHLEVLTGGKVDRIDIVSGVTRVVDYKSGAVVEVINSIGDLFADDRKKDSDGWLQTLLYCEAYLANKPGSVLRPSVYKIKKLAGSFISDKLKLKTDSKDEMVIDDYKMIREEFVYGLKEIIAKIFSIDEPFSMTSDTRGKCSFCPYRSLCMR